MYMIFKETISRVISGTKTGTTHEFAWLILESIPLKCFKLLPVLEIPSVITCVADVARVDS